MVSGDKIEFLLIIAPVKESYQLAHAALKVADEFKVSAKVCVMWPSNTHTGAEMSCAAGGAPIPYESYLDVVEMEMEKEMEVVKKSSKSKSWSWWDICKMTDKGAILVRPDDHIAWRAAKTGIVGDPILEMRRVFSAILG